jgi:single-strand DNA-binding protein
MKKGTNLAIIRGFVGNDPEVKIHEKGTITTCSIATGESWKDKTSGEWKNKTEWHRIVFYGKLAEIAGDYIKKGSHVYVEGSLQTRKWTDKAGVERYTTEIIASEMQMLDAKEKGAESVKGANEPVFDDQIPF